MLLSTRFFLTAPSCYFPVSPSHSLFFSLSVSLPLPLSLTSVSSSLFQSLANKRFAQSRITLRIRNLQPNVCYVIFSLTLATRFGRQMLRFNAHFLVPTHTHTVTAPSSPLCCLPCCGCCCCFLLSVSFVALFALLALLTYFCHHLRIVVATFIVCANC